MLCGSAAALIAVSVPLVGMNAFGEAGAPAATPTGTVETEEAAVTTEEVKNVEFVDSFDSENLFTSTTNGFGINKMYSQKNELGNGKYNQRFIMQVKTADVANIDSYSIIISSGTKNVKINCYGLSSSITINGNNIKADEDCVFLSAAVVDVNDSVELSYSDFTYEHGGVVDEA